MRCRYELIPALCPPCFAGIVLYVQSAQPAYVWRTQFMSELALGAQGFMMHAAFGALALGAAGLIPCFRAGCRGDPFTRWLFSGLFALAAAAFVVAGAVTLARGPTLHIGSVFVAFVALATAMFVTFRHAAFGALRWFSLAALLFALAALVSGSSGLLAAGLAQRLTALGILGWMSAAGVYFLWSRKS